MSKRWWLWIFWHFVDVSVTNAFIISDQCRNKENLSLKQFRLALVEGQVSGTLPVKKGRKRSSTDSLKRAKSKVSLEKRRSAAAYMPEIIAQNRQRRCALCFTKQSIKVTRWTCQTCNVPLCLSAERNCFAAFHK